MEGCCPAIPDRLTSQKACVMNVTQDIPQMALSQMQSIASTLIASPMDSFMECKLAKR
jgi:hypothetical protein